MEYLCVDTLFPEWHMWEQFVADNLGGALMLDALKNTHPVEVPVHHPDEISEVFDAISYEKGASLIRMLAHYIGEENFQKGVQHYLKKHSYKNTVTKDLWASFEQVSKKPITKIMKEWTTKAGHPIVTLEQDTQRGCTCLSQKRFFISPKEDKSSKSTDVWPIPLSYKDELGEHRTLFDKKSTTIKMEALEYINLGQTGVYRALYDKDTLEAIALRIEQDELSPEERLGVVRDIHASVRNCSMKLETALVFLECLREEKHYTVWAEMVSLLTHIRFIYQGTKHTKNIEKYIRYFVDAIYVHVGYTKRKGESHTETLLRTLVLGLVVSTGDKIAIQKGTKLFSSKQIDPDIRSTVYASVVKSGDKRLFDKLCARYTSAHMHEEKNRLARARIGTPNKREFTATLNWVLSGDVRSQDIPMYLAQSLYNRYNKEHALAFVLKKWDMLVQKYSGDKYTRSRIIGALDAFDTIDDFKKIKKFFETHEHRGAERTLKQSLETIEANIAFKKYHQKSIEKLFA